MTEPMSLLPAALRIAEARGMKIPDGCEFGMRTVHLDFTSSHGFRWPFPGRWAKASGPFTKSDSPCPSHPGDGLCVGLSWAGMASGGIPAAAVLLVAFREADVLARDGVKLRARRVFVVDVVTPRALLAERRADESVDLLGADLRGVDLHRANLAGANLHGANLHRANLAGANLTGANLAGANLAGANLAGANLAGANLAGANLAGANLAGWERGPDGYARRTT